MCLFQNLYNKEEGMVLVGEELSLTGRPGKVLCVLPVNRQEGILSSVSPPGHWLTSSHSRCTLTFAKSDFSHVSEHCPRGTKLLTSVSWEHLPVISPVPQRYCITSHLRLITIAPHLLNLQGSDIAPPPPLALL